MFIDLLRACDTAELILDSLIIVYDLVCRSNASCNALQ